MKENPEANVGAEPENAAMDAGSSAGEAGYTATGVGVEFLGEDARGRVVRVYSGGGYIDHHLQGLDGATPSEVLSFACDVINRDLREFGCAGA